MKGWTVPIVVLSVSLCWGSDAAAQSIEGLDGAAAAAIEAEIRRGDFGSPVTAHVFYGDLTGTGTNDAIALLYHPSGGNSDLLTTWIWRETDKGYRLARKPSNREIFGLDPRNVRFSAGRVSVTTTVLKPGDPRCCPSGRRTFEISLDGAATAASANRLDVPVMEHGGDGQMANCSSSTVTGLKADGDGFLAVRSGPGTRYRKLDELHNGDVVIVFERRGAWAGIAYEVSRLDCASTRTRPVEYPKRGWVHTDWLRDLAG